MAATRRKIVEVQTQESRRFQEALNALARRSIGGYEVKLELVREVSQTRRSLGLALRLRDDPQERRVSVTVVRSATRRGIFQVACTADDREVLWNRAAFPDLVAVPSPCWVPRPLTPEDALDEAVLMVNDLGQELPDARKRFQAILDALSGTSLDSFPANHDLVRRVNFIRKSLQLALRLRHGKDRSRVSLRCTNAPCSARQGGTFQATATRRPQRTLYSGEIFPPLEVFEPETDR